MTPERPSLELRWNENFEALSQYVDQQGKLPDRFGEFHSLYEWATLQRYKHRAKTLRQDRAGKLAEIPGLLFERTDRMSQLEYFYEVHGRLPKSTAVDPHEAAVARYLVHSLRPLIAKGKISDRLAARAAAIPGATEFRRNPDQEERLDQFEDYIDEHGHLPYASRDEHGTTLYHWMRNTVAGDPDEKSEVLRERHLTVAHLVRTTPLLSEYRWRIRLAEVESLSAALGHRPVHLPGLKTQQETNRWFGKLVESLDRNEFDEVTAMRVRKVLTFPTVREHTWLSSLESLRAFVACHGRPPRGFHEDGYNWLSRQRRDLKDGKLTPDHFELLNNIDGVLPVVARRDAA